MELQERKRGTEDEEIDQSIIADLPRMLDRHPQERNQGVADRFEDARSTRFTLVGEEVIWNTETMIKDT